MYKANKDQVNVFGLQTQYGGGKTTGFALVYDSPEALKKFEPHYRLVRVGVASKIEKPSRQQRTSSIAFLGQRRAVDANGIVTRQATQEQTKDTPGYRKGQGCGQEEGEIDNSPFPGVADGGKLVLREWALCLYACIRIGSAYGASGAEESTLGHDDMEIQWIPRSIQTINLLFVPEEVGYAVMNSCCDLGYITQGIVGGTFMVTRSSSPSHLLLEVSTETASNLGSLQFFVLTVL
jgi:hypothetical protein